MIALHKIKDKIKTGIKKNKREFFAIKNKLYPQFVFDNELKTIKDEIPVFTLHSVNPSKFESQLKYLSQNSYNTVTSEQLYNCLIGESKIEERTIALTFDDGWQNLYTVVFPLLKKYNLNATCFLIPNLIETNKNVRGVSPNLVVPDSDIMCTWQEIAEMHESGFIDFQSHSMNHYLISVSSKITEFYYPNYDTYPFNMDLPLLKCNGIDDYKRNLEFGTPIYENDSRFCGKKRFLDDENLRKKCTDYVAKNGNEEFFQKINWKRELSKIVDDFYKKNTKDKHYESDSEMRESIFNEMSLSKKIIEEKLENKIVRHFCYPWWTGSGIALEISKEAGYLSNYWGVDPNRKTNKLHDNPFKISRILSDDFIFTLPGEGRKTLVKLIYEKFLNEISHKFAG